MVFHLDSIAKEILRTRVCYLKEMLWSFKKEICSFTLRIHDEYYGTCDQAYFFPYKNGIDNNHTQAG